MSRLRVLGIVVASLVTPLVVGLQSTHAAQATCFGVAATIVGRSDNDTILGTPRADVIVAGSGADDVKAGGGSDLVCAGNGNDLVSGGAGNDRVKGGAGNDVLSGLSGDDQLFGMTGDDQLDLDQGDDLLDGGEGVNLAIVEGHGADGTLDVDLAAGLAMGQGNDTLLNFRNLVVFDWAGTVAASGNDLDNLFEIHAGTAVLRGHGGDDAFLSLESGDDALYGGTGDDQLLAGDGKDYLDGGPGTDYLDGEGGTDTCVNGESLSSCP